MDLTDVKGIGPATAIKLSKGGITSAELLADKEPDQLIVLGITKSTATKIINNAKEIVGTAVKEIPKKVKPKKETVKKAEPKKETVKKAEPKKEIPKKVEPEKEKEVKVPDGELLISKVSGVGPIIEKTLQNSGIVSARQLSQVKLDDLVDFGIRKVTAKKIINNAQELIQTEVSSEAVEEIIEETLEEDKPKSKKPQKKVKKKDEPTPVSSPPPQGIPTRKKRGLQIKAQEKLVEQKHKKVKKPEGWVVTSRKLSKEELEAKRIRQEEIAQSRKITRVIPIPPEVIKSIKTKETKVTKRPEKLQKKRKRVKKIVKKKKIVTDFYTQKDIYPSITNIRRRGVSVISGTKKPRIELDRDTYLGKITSHRRSRRVIHPSQVIVDLDEGFNPDQLAGQKVYFTYPDNEMKVPGSISKRFGKTSSSKVLVYFKKGIRVEGIHQKIFIK